LSISLSFWSPLCYEWIYSCWQWNDNHARRGYDNIIALSCKVWPFGSLFRSLFCNTVIYVPVEIKKLKT
jgi:hypothetical protein